MVSGGDGSDGSGDGKGSSPQMVPDHPMDGTDRAVGGSLGEDGGSGSGKDAHGIMTDASGAVASPASKRRQQQASTERYCTVENVGIPKYGSTVKMLRAAVAEAAGLDPKRVALTQVSSHYCSKYLTDQETLSYVSPYAQWVAHDVDDAITFNGASHYYRNMQPPEDHPLAAMTILFRREETQAGGYYSYRPRVTKVVYAEPLLLCQPKRTSPKDIYEAVAAELGAGVTPAMFSLYVSHNAVGSSVDRVPVERDNVELIHPDMKAFITLALEWEISPEDVQAMKIPGLYDPAAAAAAAGGGGGEGPAAAESAVAAAEKKGDLSLVDCFELFSTPEKLEESDMWYCSKCKEHVRATKTMQLWSVPDVLVLHLKRFAFSTFRREKVETKVDFPLDGLDLSKYVHGPQPLNGGAVYDCVAVSNHMGNLGGGHYVAASAIARTASGTSSTTRPRTR